MVVDGCIPLSASYSHTQHTLTCTHFCNFCILYLCEVFPLTNSMHSKYVLEFLILLVFHFIFILGLRISDPDMYEQLLNSKYQRSSAC